MYGEPYPVNSYELIQINKHSRSVLEDIINRIGTENKKELLRAIRHYNRKLI